jgi:hypothetical protein
MNACTPVRPEERRRDVDSPAWADTVPACFRSEAFAEDLYEPPSTTAPPLPPPPARPRQWRAAGRDPAGAVAAQSPR